MIGYRNLISIFVPAPVTVLNPNRSADNGYAEQPTITAAPPVARTYDPIEANLVGIQRRMDDMRAERDDLDQHIRVLSERSRQLNVSIEALHLAELQLNDAMMTVAVVEVLHAAGK